uniref:Cilia- and flagella-associated protein 61 N-terminal domain-containing protein n=1 Tax=Cavia porcellus TaxID=10141 RepID=H0UWK3_CAVPO
MSILTSPRGKAEVVHCRRTESQDIYCIQKLIRKFTQKLFGRLNIIYLLEKANLAITLCNDREEIMAQATFLDYPNWNVATPEAWPSVFRELDSDIPCTPLNTLFLHLFVAVNEYSVGCCKEIIRTVFKAVPDLHFIFLIVPSYMSLGSTLVTVFNPVGSVPCLTFNEDFAVYVCHRHSHYPQLHIRKARVEDHDDLMPIFMRHDTVLKDTYGEYFLAELIEAQDQENHAVVCEVEGVAVGFMSVCSRVNLRLLHECFDLGPFHGFCIPHPEDILEPPKEPRSAGMVATQGRHLMTGLPLEPSFSLLASILLPEEPGRFRPVYRGDASVFCIQLFCIDEKYEARSLDFMNFVFSLFPGKNFCIISVPQLTPEFALIQNFVKVIPFDDCTLQHDLYVFHRAGLFKSITVRLANRADTPGVEQLLSSLMLSQSILEDLAQYNEARRDPDGTPLQAFVAEVAEQVVGIAVIRNEMDIEYIRSHYNIEDFIYFNHHQRDEHGRLHHLALNPAFRHYTKFFLKEILRLGSKTCLYYPVYPQTREGKVR